MTVSCKAASGYSPATAMPVARSMASEVVLDAAEALVGSEGFSGLSVRRLASALGVSRQVVYTHFGGLEGLWNALYRRGADRLAARVAALDETPGTVAHVHAASHAYVAAARQSPHLFQLVFARPVPDFDPDADARRVGRAAFGVVVWVCGCWLAGEEVPREAAWASPEAVGLARVLWACVHGHVVIEAAGHAEEAMTDALVTRAVESLLAGWPRS
jgi:AcrR family transcriptional regulator